MPSSVLACVGMLSLLPHFALAAPTGHLSSVGRAAPVCDDPDVSWDEKHAASCPVCVMDDLPIKLVAEWCGPVMNPATSMNQVNQVYRRDVEEVAAWAENVADDELPLEVEEMSREDEAWLLDHLVDGEGNLILESNEHLANASDVPKDKPVHMRPENRLYKPQDTVIARARMPEASATYADLPAETPLPRSWPLPHYPVEADEVIGDPIERFPIFKPVPVIDYILGLKPMPTDPTEGEIQIMNVRRNLQDEDDVLGPPTVATPTNDLLTPSMAAAATSNGQSAFNIVSFPDKAIDHVVFKAETHRPAYGLYRRDVEGPAAIQQPSLPIAEALGNIASAVEQSSQDIEPHEVDESLDTSLPVNDRLAELRQDWVQVHEHAGGSYRRSNDDTILETDSLAAQSVAAHKASNPAIIKIHLPAPEIFRRQQREPAPVDDLDFEMVDDTLPSEPSVTPTKVAVQSQTVEPTVIIAESVYTHKPAPTLWRRNEELPPQPAEIIRTPSIDTLPGHQEPSDDTVEYSPAMGDSTTHNRVDRLWRRRTTTDSEAMEELLEPWRHNMGHGPVIGHNPFLNSPGPVIPENDGSSLPLKRSPVPPPEFFEDRPWPFERRSPVEGETTSPEDVHDIWSKYETPPTVEPTVEHMLRRSDKASLETRAPADDEGDRGYRTITPLSIKEYSKVTPALIMKTANRVYKRSDDSPSPIEARKEKKKSKNKDIELLGPLPPWLPALTHEGKMRVYRRQHDSNISEQMKEQTENDTTFTPALTHEVKTKVYRRQPDSLDFKKIKGQLEDDATAAPARVMHTKWRIWRRDAVLTPEDEPKVSTADAQPVSRVWWYTRGVNPDNQLDEPIKSTSEATTVPVTASGLLTSEDIEHGSDLEVRSDATSSASAPRRTDNIRHEVLPVVSRVYRRALQDRLKASSSKAATTTATPTSTLPSSTRTPVVTLSHVDLWQQNTPSIRLSDPSKATVHGSVKRVWKDPTLNGRGVISQASTVPAPTVSPTPKVKIHDGTGVTTHPRLNRVFDVRKVNGRDFSTTVPVPTSTQPPTPTKTSMFAYLVPEIGGPFFPFYHSTASKVHRRNLDVAPEDGDFNAITPEENEVQAFAMDTENHEPQHVEQPQEGVEIIHVDVEEKITSSTVGLVPRKDKKKKPNKGDPDVWGDCPTLHRPENKVHRRMTSEEFEAMFGDGGEWETMTPEEKQAWVGEDVTPTFTTWATTHPVSNRVHNLKEAVERRGERRECPEKAEMDEGMWMRKREMRRGWRAE